MRRRAERGESVRSASDAALRSLADQRPYLSDVAMQALLSLTHQIVNQPFQSSRFLASFISASQSSHPLRHCTISPPNESASATPGGGMRRAHGTVRAKQGDAGHEPVPMRAPPPRRLRQMLYSRNYRHSAPKIAGIEQVLRSSPCTPVLYSPLTRYYLSGFQKNLRTPLRGCSNLSILRRRSRKFRE